MEAYEFRIFPPARMYRPPDGAQVFVNLNSEKHTGLGTLTPANEALREASDTCRHEQASPKDDLRHAADSQAADISSATSARADADSPGPQLPAGLTTEGRRFVQYAVGGSAYVRPARFTPVRPTASHATVCHERQKQP